MIIFFILTLCHFFYRLSFDPLSVNQIFATFDIWYLLMFQLLSLQTNLQFLIPLSSLLSSLYSSPSFSYLSDFSLFIELINSHIFTLNSFVKETESVISSDPACKDAKI